MLSAVVQLLLPFLFGSLAVCSPIDLVERAVLLDRAADLQAEYDYVIIGGGTSGLTVANRLTENTKSTVTLSRLRNTLRRILIICAPSTASVLVIEYGYVYVQSAELEAMDIES